MASTRTNGYPTVSSVSRRFPKGYLCSSHRSKGRYGIYRPENGWSISEQRQAIQAATQGVGAYSHSMQGAQAALTQAGAFAQPGAATQFMNHTRIKLSNRH